MKFVYILQSVQDPTRHYTGIADDINMRLQEHNSLECKHTQKYAPWKIIVSTGFDDHEKAYMFEKYLKSGSGRAFAKRHF